MMICNAKWQPLNEEAKSGFTFGCCIRGLPTSNWYLRLWSYHNLNFKCKGCYVYPVLARLCALHQIIRWFKFTLQPPNSITHGNFFSAIWDTSHWNFLSNLDSRHLMTSPRILLGQF